MPHYSLQVNKNDSLVDMRILVGDNEDEVYGSLLAYWNSSDLTVSQLIKQRLEEMGSEDPTESIDGVKEILSWYNKFNDLGIRIDMTKVEVVDHNDELRTRLKQLNSEIKCN